MRSKRLPLGLKKTKKRKLFKQLFIIAVSIFVIFSQMSISPLSNALAETGNTSMTPNNSQFFDATKPVQLTTGTEPDQTKEVSQNDPIQKDNKVNVEYNYNLSQNLLQSLTKQLYTTTINIPKEFQFDSSALKGDIKLADNTTVIGSYSIDTKTNALTLTINKTATALSSAKGKIALPATFNNDLQEGQSEIKFDLGNIANSPYAVPVWTVNDNQNTSNGSSAVAKSSTSSTAGSSSNSGSFSSTGSSSSATISSSSNAISSADSGNTINLNSSSTSSSGTNNKTSTQSSENDVKGTNIQDSPSSDNETNSKSNLLQRAGLKSVTLFDASSVADTSAVFGNTNILDSVTLTDSSNQPYDADNPAKTDAPVNIDFTWSIPDDIGKNVKSGDTYTFDLPKEFIMHTPITNGTLGDYGTFTVDTHGHVVMTFNQNVSTDSNVQGTLYIKTQFDQAQISGPTTQTITFPVKDTAPPVIVHFAPNVDKTITKQGALNNDINPTQVTWTVDINKKLASVTNAKVTEDWPKDRNGNLQTNFSSIKVYNLGMDVDGTPHRGSLVDPSSYDVDPANGKVTFNGTINSAYELVYETSINNATIPDDGGNVSLINTASFSGDGLAAISADATVTANFGKMIDKTKTSYDGPSQTFGWKLDYNFASKHIDQKDATITDTFPTDKLHLLDGLTIKQVTGFNGATPTFSNTALKEGTDYSLTKTDTGFTIHFKNDVNTPYVITYQTQVNDGVYIDSNTSSQDSTYLNSVETGTGATGEDSGTAVSQGLVKDASSPDYENKTINWSFTVNKSKYEMQNWKLADTFDSGALAYVPGSMKIHDDTNNKYLTGFKVTPTNLEGTNGFEIDLNATTSSQLTITYQTKFNVDFSNPDTAKNSAVATWTDKSGGSHTDKAEKDLPLNNSTQFNGFKNGSYNPISKEITWKVGVNYNGEKATNAYITDPITDNQQFIPYDDNNQVLVKPYTIKSDGTVNEGDPLTKGYTVTPPSQGNNVLRVDFNTGTDDTKQYMVIFKTSLVRQVIHDQDNYTNIATYHNGTYPPRDITGKVSISHGGELISKNGQQNEGSIDWTINVNASQSDLQNVVVTDNPDPQAGHEGDQILDPNLDNYKVYAAKYDDKGPVYDGKELVPDTSKQLARETDYTLKITTDNTTGKQNFVLTFIGDYKHINTAYVIKYSSLINIAGDSGDVQNQVSISGDNVTTQTQQNDGSAQVQVTTGGGTATGEKGSLSILKTDSKKNPLSGATIELLKTDGTTILRTGTTDTDGKLTFGAIRYGNYLLKEVKAPDGYMLNTDYMNGKKVSINSTTSTSGVQTTIVDNKPSAKLIKVDSDNPNVKLKGAEFELQDQDGKPVTGFGTLSTDQNGQLTIPNLELGKTYQLVETKAPVNYAIDPTPHPFTIAADQTTVKNLGTITNSLTRGSVVLTKTDADDGHVLSGAEFDLYDANNNKINGVPLVTNEDGQINVDNLKPGDYHFVETKAANDDYTFVSDTSIRFTIQKGQVNPLSLPVTNSLKTGSVELTKVDFDNNDAPLTGAVFELQDNKGETLKSGLTDPNGDGKIFVDNLKPGDYQFVETKAPDGYVLNQTPVTFSIVKGQKETLKIHAPNALKTGGVILTKYGEDNKELGLQGAVYKLEDSSSKLIKDNLTTNDKGQISYDGLKPGNYQFIETKAPNGYDTDSTPITFTITKGQTQAVTKTAIDSETPGSLILTKYDSEDHTKTLQGATFDLLGSDKTIEVKQNLTTDENGKISVDGLKPGTYYFKETKAPTNYNVNNDLVKAVVDKGQTTAVSVRAYDTLTPGSAKLIKKAAEDHNTLLHGAEYKIVRLNSVGNQVWVKEHLVTDQFGQITVNDLAPGHYQFIETTSPTNYQLDPTPIDVTVVPGQQSVADATVTAYDTLTPGDAHIIKTDESTGSVLSGAVFNVVDSTGAAVKTGVSTGLDGTVTVKDLAPGNYQLIETKAPTGYTKSIQAIPFTIDKGQILPKDVSVTDKMLPGSIKLTKVDGDHTDTVLKGAEYELLNSDGSAPSKDNDGQTVADQTTGSDGTLTFSNLRPGAYMLKEVTPPAGYQKNDNLVSVNVPESTVDNQPPATKSITVQDYKGSLTLTKTDSSGNVGLKGAVFQLTGPDGTKELTSDADGVVSATGLSTGDYTIKEIHAPDGYLLNDKIQTFTIDGINKTGNKPVPVKLRLTDEDNVVTLIKSDANNSSSKLKGAVFELQDSKGNTVSEDANGKAISSSLTTDDHGEISVKNLKAGDYQFVETQAPSGYELNATKYPFTIKNTDTKVAASISATDKLNTVTLTKSDVNDKSAVLIGAEFELQDSKGNAVTRDVTGKDLQSRWTTDKNGQFSINGLPVGNYQFVETKAPSGYQLDKTPIPFTVTNTVVKAIPITATDKINSITLTKVDKNDNNIHLQGAEFQLYESNNQLVTKDVNGKSLPTTWTTDKNGQFTVNGLTPGTYYFKETKAPAGYDLDAVHYPFTVTNKDAQAHEITATDKQNEVTLTKEDKNDSNIHLQGAEFKLYDSNNRVVTKDAGGKSLPSVWTTDSNGQFTVKNLISGDYHFVESKAPYGYDLDTVPYPFKVTATDVKAIPITATDKLTPGDAVLTKVDKNDKNIHLQGAVFTLKDSSGKALKTGLTTDNNGQFVVKGLAPGKYFFVETKAPKNYLLDSTPIPFTISKGQAKAVEITASDQSKTITKELTGKPGATYNVVDQDGHVITHGVMADSEGHVHFKGLASGKYHLAPVRGTEAIVNVKTLPGKPGKNNSGSLPKTGDTNDIVAMASGAVLLVAGGAVVFFSRRRRNN
ncbi:SpaA isopeptide-forming pilin-related protein [Sporolactobacillus vineae]|uniref:SpaA isopeptide-forming pilin-related protein n=1 Tax=Sporolactobacillus vineae TaxID=444463 RepID=UPI0002887728|nr:SpaA isopeptide-forming pilin-related protein [Sporolactobacillus vineae]